MLRQVVLCFFLLFPSGAVFADESNPLEESPLQEETRQLVRKLGDDSFVVRERAEAQLLRIGIDAYAELQRARNDSDVEIARRAEKILSQYEMLFIGQEHESVRYWITFYAFQTDPVEKGKVIWLLCNPFSDARNGEGLRTLCRIARFDETHSLRAEAVKGLIASPPVTPAKQRKWYRSLREMIADPGDDELLRLLALFVDLRCTLDDKKEAAEIAAKEEEKRTGVPVLYPVIPPVDEMLRQRVRELTDRIAAFQAKPENNEIRPGNRNDILLFYALAELQELVGLTEERDRTVAAAAAVRTEDASNENPLELGESRPFYDHFLVARILRYKYRLKWSMQHALLVAEHGYLLFKIDACQLAAETCQFEKRFPESIRYFDQAIELAKSKDFTDLQSNSAELVKKFSTGRFLTLAQQAVEAGDWDKVREHVDAGLKLDPYELDILILAWRLCQRRPGPDENYRKEIDRKIDSALRNIERGIYREPNTELRRYKALDACNQAAWLLANTGGDYASSLALIEEAVKEEPESIAYLDTLAHVYSSGKQYDKAVEAQETAVRLAPEGVIFRDALERFRKERDENRGAESDAEEIAK